jgi:ubiquinone/menaquinone biosynthesis C-methylase UbiE
MPKHEPLALTGQARTERLRASPNFALTFAQDGRPYVVKDSEPYIQYWLTERYRILLSLFSTRRGATEAGAIAAWYRLTETKESARNRRALSRAIHDMRGAGVLISTHDDVSRYDASIATDYVTYRPFPQDIADQIIRDAPVESGSRVLDLAGGPGSLAMALARASNNVSLMELSRGFLGAAQDRAAKAGLRLTTLHESCNRLVYMDNAFDVITVSQALHWLDDVMVCRGVCRLLRQGGSFIVIHAGFDVPADHPLAFLLGRRSVLGDKVEQPFAAEIRPLARRLSLLLEALDAPDVDRVTLGQHAVAAGGDDRQRIALENVALFRQRRPMGRGFARAFLTSRHIEATGQTPDSFWRDLTARCAGASPSGIGGTFDWALLHFRRGARHPAQRDLAAIPVIEIGYEGPPES